MRVLTLATNDIGYLPALKFLCKKNNHNLDILEFGSVWKGFSWRILKTLHKLRKLDADLQSDEIIMLVDAYDILVLADHTEIITKFNLFNCDVIFSASCKYSGQPNLTLIYQHIIHKISSIYFDKATDTILNAGSLIGKVKCLKLIFERMYKYHLRTNVCDDQILLNKIYLKDINYKIDYESTIFWIWECSSLQEYLHLTLFGATFEINNNIRYTTDGRVSFNNIQPCVVHGIYNRVMDKLCKSNRIPTSKLVKKKTSQTDLYILLIIVKILLIVLFIFIVQYIVKYLIKRTFSV